MLKELKFFVTYFLIWIGSNLSIPFWMLGHFHLMTNVYEDIQEIIAKLKFRNIGILITDHNVNETLSICDRAYLLIDGKIFKHGTAEELAVDEQVRRLYLGRNFELKRKDYLHLEAAKLGKSINEPESEL